MSAKNILLVSESGFGKSSMVNCLFHGHDAAPEAQSYLSCTKEIKLYNIPCSTIGPVNVIDTAGFNDTDANIQDSDSIFKLFIELCNKKGSVDKLDAILYLCPASTDAKFHYDKNMKLFSKMFNANFEQLKESVIFIFTKHENLNMRLHDEADKYMNKISDNFGIPAMKWDSKFPLVDQEYNQFETLERLLQNCKPFKLEVESLRNEFNQLASDLREKDRIVKNPFLRTKYTKQEHKIFEHKEYISGSGFIDILALGFTRINNNLSANETFYIKPEYPVQFCENKWIGNIKYEIESNYNVCWHTLQINKNNDSDSAVCESTIWFSRFSFGNSNLKYRVSFDYGYELVEPNPDPEYIYQPIESFFEKAKHAMIDKRK